MMYLNGLKKLQMSAYVNPTEIRDMKEDMTRLGD
jgi:hypothetical protein